MLALIVNVDGFPLSYETFDGDRTDVTTLETIMRMVERKSTARSWVRRVPTRYWPPVDPAYKLRLLCQTVAVPPTRGPARYRSAPPEPKQEISSSSSMG